MHQRRLFASQLPGTVRSPCNASQVPSLLHECVQLTRVLGLLVAWVNELRVEEILERTLQLRDHIDLICLKCRDYHSRLLLRVRKWHLKWIRQELPYWNQENSLIWIIRLLIFWLRRWLRTKECRLRNRQKSLEEALRGLNRFNLPVLGSINCFYRIYLLTRKFVRHHLINDFLNFLCLFLVLVFIGNGFNFEFRENLQSRVQLRICLENPIFIEEYESLTHTKKIHNLRRVNNNLSNSYENYTSTLFPLWGRVTLVEKASISFSSN